MYIIGFLAQIFFSGRIILQWIISERAKRVVSPSIFWILSIVASYLLFVYGWLRDDFAIIFGQFISYYIYLWNIKMIGIWAKINVVVRLLLLATPIFAIGFMLHDVPLFVENFFKNEKVPLWLLVLGSMGQIIFTLRFVYQWIYSVKHKESMLPAGFWAISLIGSFVIIAYAVVRLDPVLILGQSVGFVAYFRNLAIWRTNSKQSIAYEE